jgi:hypothetical protein
MSNWGATDADESKPKYLTAAQKKEVYATEAGWVVEAGSKMTGNGRTGADPEVLVAISSLSTSIGQADVTDVEFVSTGYSEAAPGVFSALVRFNENVTVSGTPTLYVNSNQAGSGSLTHLSCTYASGSGSNELTFTKTCSAGELAEDDVLNHVAAGLELAGGTIVDTAAGGNATLTVSAAIATAGGTLTVAA